MPHAVHRLNLYLVPDDPDRVPAEDLVDGALCELTRRQVLVGGRPGPRADALIEGGFRLLRVDRPGRPVLYGNRLGGYRARCPRCAINLVPGLGPALASWRAGGGRDVRCPGCDVVIPLEGVRYAPDAAPGRFAIELLDVQQLRPRPSAEALLKRALDGGFVVVGSRG